MLFTTPRRVRSVSCAWERLAAQQYADGEAAANEALRASRQSPNSVRVCGRKYNDDDGGGGGGQGPSSNIKIEISRDAPGMGASVPRGRWHRCIDPGRPSPSPNRRPPSEAAQARGARGAGTGQTIGARARARDNGFAFVLRASVRRVWHRARCEGPRCAMPSGKYGS